MAIRTTALAAALLGAAACGMDRTTQLLSPTDQASFARKAATPTITEVSPSSASLTIGFGSDFTVAVANPAPNASAGNLSVVATIVQGNASRAAGSAQPTCAGTPGLLPPNTGCAVPITVTPSNEASGSGTLSAGNAKLVFTLVAGSGASATTLDTKTVKVTLIGGVYVADVQLHFTSLQIGSTALNTYTMTLGNGTGADQSIYSVQGYIVQGAVIHVAGSANVCDLTGIVPAGGCTFDWHTFAQNSQPNETGTLVAGSATLRLDLIHFDGTTSSIVETRLISVELTSP